MLKKQRRVKKWQNGGFNTLFSAAGLTQNGTSTIMPQPPAIGTLKPSGGKSVTNGIFSKANIGNTMNIAGQAADILSSFIPKKEQSGLTTGLNAGYDAVANGVGMIPGVGTVIGGAMKVGGLLSDGLTALGVGTDQMTTADKILDSKFLKLTPVGLINSIGAKKADTIYKDNETWEQQGSAYGGSLDKVDNALTKSGKKYGLFSNKGRKKANAQIAEAKRQQNLVAGINEEAQDAFQSQAGSIDMLNRRNALAMAGGYQSRGMRVGKVGVKLPTLEEIQKARLTVSKFQRGGAINKPRTLDELIIYANGSSANFVKRLNENTIRTIPTDNGSVMSHLLGYADVNGKTVVFPQVQEIDGKLKYFEDWKEALDSAIQRKDTLEMLPEEAELFTSKYKTKYAGFKTGKFLEGGKMNVIPDGALHAHKNHMDVDGITSKGIPVVTEEDGGVIQHAEIERNEIIFNKEVTEKLEALAKKGTDEAAIEAGKILSREIMENTQDNTGLMREVTI